MSFDVSCVVPRWGRTFINIMRRLKKECGPEDAEAMEKIIAVISDGKKHSAAYPAPVLEYIKEQSCPYITPAVDRKRPNRPYRPGFLGMEIEAGGIRLRIEGDEPHNGSSLIKLDEVDFTIVGLDELLSMNQHYLRNPEKVTKWGLYNYNIEKETDLRICGSANLTSFNSGAGKEITDFVGFFLIANRPGTPEKLITTEELVRHRHPVFVKGRYEGIVHAICPGLNTVSSDNVEDSVIAERGSVGIEIVQSGSTLRRKGLTIHGSPLFISESLFVADYSRFLRNKKLKRLLEILGPSGYFDDERIDHYAEWFKALRDNMNNAWLSPPPPEDLFCSAKEMKNGLRPYRLRTRRWMPSDDYKSEEAEKLVKKSIERIKNFKSGKQAES
ncbi:MAG: hypothetical protein ACLFQK_11120 [Fibrobacterota bacterium]